MNRPAPPLSPPAAVRPSATGITVALCIEGAAALFTVVIAMAVTFVSTQAAGPLPDMVLFAIMTLLAMVVLRCGALALVRVGHGWARWVYVVVLAVRTVVLLPFPLPINYLLLAVAVATLILIFRRPAGLWLKERAAARSAS